MLSLRLCISFCLFVLLSFFSFRLSFSHSRFLFRFAP
jgi:hypothetical protein